MKVVLWLMVLLAVIGTILIIANGGPHTVHCVQRVNSNATCYDSP